MIYFGYKNIYGTIDAGTTFYNVTGSALFTNGATCLAVAPSTSNYLYAADYSHVYRSTNKGVTWSNITGNLPVTAVAISHLAVDYTDSNRVYVTMSGYTPTSKVYTLGATGTTWTSIGNGLPNLPANCIAVDSTTPGALFVGTDMGVYYTDSSFSGFIPYGTGLPNVIANHIHINYGNYKVRVATYGRGIWQSPLVKVQPSRIANIGNHKDVSVHAYPNPTTNKWRLIFQNRFPANYLVNVTDMTGKLVTTQSNSDIIDATAFPAGVYTIDITAGDVRCSLKAIKE